ncbi:olfactory receptor 2A2-like [Echinops telfairi]|uniref:Olfactory receptor n=1 Tax=Echinops telfairi TaxID=9371 RepID=A0ABM0J3H4_ECHTE|nr:olfactory receptor 2A2-like [Echinops telfairi]
MGDNHTRVTEFILLGFTLTADMELLLCGIFSLFFVFSLLANGMILGLIWLDPRLHTPMYFYLTHLAVLDLSYATNNVPPILGNLAKHEKTISFASCITQMYFFLTFAATECFILVVMSYDRYVAICHPLQYTVIMSWKVCVALAVISWGGGIVLSLIHITFLLRLPFCGPREVNHVFCEVLSVLRLACADTSINEILIFSACVLIIVGPVSFMLISYTRIIRAILKIQSGEGRKKAFSTCSSHLCVVGFYFGIAMLVYLIPNSDQLQEQQKILSMFYGLFNPMLNPLIYSLRNAQVKSAFYRVLQKTRAM